MSNGVPLAIPNFPWIRDGDAAVVLPSGEGGSRYRDPFTGEPSDREQTLRIVEDWRAIVEANHRIVVACGMAWWKRARINQFLWAEGRPPLIFEEDATRAVARADGREIAVWPSRMPDGLADRAAGQLVRIEDGFIRSVGLGADLHPPLSIVVDRSGIYYDPTHPSDLETILQNASFGQHLQARAEQLIETIVTRGISKYATTPPPPLSRRGPGRCVLVTGQVEDDLSVKLGGAGIRSNLELLARARAAEPDAYVIFKPHPDVDAGHRVGRVPDAELLRYADKISRGETMPSLLARVDAVHVLTSLTGFEALLRGVEVIVHGHPFYAGWGLTHDLAGPLPRRTRTLSLPELVAGTLILYPRYLDPVTELPCPPEILLKRLADGWRPRPSWLTRARRLQGRMARLVGTISR